VAATKRPPKSLTALTSAALALPGMVDQAQGATPATKIELEGGLFYYDEGADHVEVTSVQQGMVAPLTDDLDLTLNAVWDSISGASPVYNAPDLECTETSIGQSVPVATDTVSGASGTPTTPPSGNGGGQASTQVDCRPTGKVDQVISPTPFDDRRKALDLKVSHYRGDMVFSLGGGISNESDYRSNYLSIEMLRDLSQKHTTLALGLSLADDEIRPANQPGVSEDKESFQGFLGVTQVLDKYSLAQVNLSYTAASGYLADPYKDVYVLDTNSVLPEQRPEDRHQWNLLGRYVRHFPALDSSLHLDYRYSQDDWGLVAQTLETTWIRSLADSWLITFGVRYYSQYEADFYQDWFDTLPADGHYSSDYRLATFGALSYRLKLSKALTDSIRIDAGVEYYDRRVGLSLWETDNTNSTDYDFVAFNVGWKLSF